MKKRYIVFCCVISSFLYAQNNDVIHEDLAVVILYSSKDTLARDKEQLECIIKELQSIRRYSIARIHYTLLDVCDCKNNDFVAQLNATHLPAVFLMHKGKLYMDPHTTYIPRLYGTLTFNEIKNFVEHYLGPDIQIKLNQRAVGTKFRREKEGFYTTYTPYWPEDPRYPSYQYYYNRPNQPDFGFGR